MPEEVFGDGLTIHYEETGSGPGLVFVHGWTMSSRFFQRQLEAFPGHRVLAPDLRGHGASSKILHGHTVATYASDLKDLLARRGVERPVLVGWSMGAMVAYEYLQQSDQAVRGLIIVDQPPSDFAWEGYEFGVFTMESLAETNQEIQSDHGSLARQFADLMLHEPDDETVAWMVDEITKVPPAIASTILLDQTLRDYRSFLPRIRVPTLVMFGEDPKLTSPAAGRYIAEQVPGARFRGFGSSSHCPFWEEADAFNEMVAEFTAEVA